MRRPYKSINLELKDQTLIFTSPYIDLEVAVDDTRKAQILCDDWKRGELSPESNLFFSPLAEFPLSYETDALPSHLSVPNLGGSAVAKDLTLDITCTEFLKRPELSEVKSFVEPNIWSWDIKELLEASRINGTQYYNPRTVYQLARELRFVSDSSGRWGKEQQDTLDRLLKENEDAFFHLVKILLTQTYYITSHCLEALSPAPLHFPAAAQQINEFIADETGHDKLLELSLFHLPPTKPGRICPILNATKASMEILKAVALYPLAFSIVVECFEGNNFAESDPMAERLKKSSHPEAALGIEKHFYINKNHQHAAIGNKFVQHLGPQCKEEVVFALRCAEITCRLGDQLSKEALLEHWQLY